LVLRLIIDACSLGSWQKSYKHLEISVTNHVTVFFSAVCDAAEVLVALWQYFILNKMVPARVPVKHHAVLRRDRDTVPDIILENVVP
jgi:hypothetical protein